MRSRNPRRLNAHAVDTGFDPTYPESNENWEACMLFPRVLACAVFVIAGLTQPTTAEQFGPSFDCHAAQQPLAQILCADSDLSRTDLRFAQAYFALLKQVGEVGKRELKQEDLQFLEAVQRQCSIPLSGQAASHSE